MANEVTDVSEVVATEKYYLPGENFEKLAERVGTFVAAAEKTPEERAEWSRRFVQLIKSKRFIPGGRILANAGTYFQDLDSGQRAFLRDMIQAYDPKNTRCGQMLNCYVIPIEDKKHGARSIYESLEDAADITAMEGGVGENFSFLRPKGDAIRGNPAYKASGPISFLKIFNASSKQLRQGGGRRGANMAVMNVDHPDIEDFVDCKRTEGEISEYNISVGIYDAFMQAVESDGDWDLKFGGKVYRTIKARSLFKKICHNAWADGGGGEPGFLFLDTAKAYWPFPNEDPITTNPCVPASTWVMTDEGPRRVSDLVGTRFKAVVDGCVYESQSDGFFKTGEKPLLKIVTKEGYSVRLTGNHKVNRVQRSTRWGTQTEWVEAEQIRPGDRLCLNDHRDHSGVWPGRGDFGEGYLSGFYVGDGTYNSSIGNYILSVWGREDQDGLDAGNEKIMGKVSEYMSGMPHRSDFQGWNKCPDRNEYRISHKALGAMLESYDLHADKHIGPAVEMASSEFQRGFLRGFFDADGTVAVSTKGNCVRLSQSDLPRLHTVQRMLLRFGIASTIYQDRGAGKTSGYPNGVPNHDLHISCENLVLFAERIGFEHSDKMKKLEELLGSYKRRMNEEKFFCEVKSISEDGTEPVYDVTISGIHAFDGDGFYLHNCGEQSLGFYEACDLGAMNLAAFLRSGEDGTCFDYDEFRSAVQVAIRFLDNVLDLNNYPLKYRNDVCRDISMRHRRIGLGIMGLADLLMASGVGYDTPEGLEYVETVMREFAKMSEEATLELGRIKGPYLDHLQAHPRFQHRRNCCTTTIAPTGTTGMVAGVWGGCEPFFGLVTRKNTTDGSGNVYYMVPEAFRWLCRKHGVTLTDERLEEIYKNRGSVQGLKWAPENMQRAAKTAMDISGRDHVRMQCALQKHIENSISKTINLPNDAKVEELEDAVFALWRGGAKGGTIYRDGSRKFQIMNVGGTRDEKKPAAEDEKRPDVMSGKTYKIVTNISHQPENVYVTVNETPDGKPFEIFIHASEEQSTIKFTDFLIHNGVKYETAQMIAGKMMQSSKENINITTRLLSLCLRKGVPIPSVVKQLRKIHSSDIYSFHKKMSKILAGYITDENVEIDICSQILQDGRQCTGKLVFQEGCLRCTSCFSSKCD